MNGSNPSIERIELKFQLDAQRAQDVMGWARDHLGVDENCDPNGGDSYAIQTLYLDTPDRDLLHRTGVLGDAKHRIRRYGQEQVLWVETKKKKKMVVSKNRTAVFESDLVPRLASDAMPSDGKSDPWCADWFVSRITDFQLEPAILIGYRRFARTSILGGEALRLTIDSQLTAAPIDRWNVSGLESGRYQAFSDCQILELKFHNQMPWLFKELLRTFPIAATAFSKYRTAMHLRSTSREPTFHA